MRRFFTACLFLLGGSSPLFAQFDYPSWPSVYRIYYADSVSNTISTAVVSLDPVNDSLNISANRILYAAGNPAGIVACGEDLYWIERTSGAVYRGRKDGSTSKSLIVSGIGGLARDLVLRGGALYISYVYRNGQWGIVKADLSGNIVQQFLAGGYEPKGMEKAAMNLLVSTTGGIHSINFNTGSTTLLTSVQSYDITVVDTSLVYTVSSGGQIYLFKRSLGGGGAASLLGSWGLTGAGHMDSVDNHVFLGLTGGYQSWLGVVGVRENVGSRGSIQVGRLLFSIGLNGLVVERLNQVKNDFDGDGLADRSVYYPATGQWYVFGTATGFYTDQFGYPGTIPVPGDYDGDGITDYGVFDPATGVWQLFRSSLGYYTTTFGSAGMMPSISDYDNDGKSDICLYNPPNGKWHIIGSKRGYFEDQFGNTYMIPVDTQTKPQY